MFDDIFSTRTGTPIGLANERTMLTKIGGPNTIRKSFQAHADGSVTMCHTRGSGSQPEFITANASIIANAISALGMDSGIADVGYTVGTDIRRYLPGSLIKTELVGSYDSKFSLASDKPDYTYVAGAQPSYTITTPWFTKPDEPSAGQVSGEISLSKGAVTGRVRNDGVAKAFSPGALADAPNPADDALVAKKRTADRCPPSMFTGRARLYAQAVFGQYMYQNTAGMPGAVSTPPSLTTSFFGSPALRLSSEGVTLNVSSGVFRDTASGKHWLINPGNGVVHIYPLISSSTGEAIREWANTAVGLSEEDSAHIETYILSACRPRADQVVTLSIGGVQPYSMGYGWHWNWSGTAADMVQHEEGQDHADGSQLATHHRLSVTSSYDPLSGVTTWAAETSIVEGPVRWATYRSLCCFTHPNWLDHHTGDSEDHLPVYWSEKGPKKFNPFVTMFASNAPIYAFYKRDELQVSRITVASNPGNYIESHTASNGFVYYFPDGSYTNHYLTLGDEDGFLRVHKSTDSVVSFTMSCAGETVSSTDGGVESYENIFVSGKSRGAFPPDTGMAVYYPRGGDFINGSPSGSPWDSPPVGYQVEMVPGPCGTSTKRFASTSFTLESNSESKCQRGFSGGIIPFFDAEAFYLIEQKWTEVNISGRVAHPCSAGFYSQETAYVSSGGDFVPGPVFEAEYWKAPNNAGESFHLDPTLTISGQAEKTVVTYRGGVLGSPAVTSDSMRMFDDANEPYIPGNFKTLSGTSSDNLLYGLINNNWPTSPIATPTLVGWV